MTNQKLERVIVLIDGSNFYYSTVKKGKKIRFEKLINEIVKDRELIGVYYYVAPLDIKVNIKKYWEHQRFLNILRGIPKFKVVLCALKKIKADDGSFVYVVKGDDVKMSNTLLMGAVENLYDTAVIVTGDEDFIDSVNIVRKKYKKRVENAYFPRSSSSNLRKACDACINLNKILNNILYQKDKEKK